MPAIADATTSPPVLPWRAGQVPLMLAPMQGLTNGAMRAALIERARPDVVFTEFVKVQGKGSISRADVAEIRAHRDPTPLVVQLIGHDAEGLAVAARHTQEAGARHLNLNLGCPYGRMTSCATGGALLRDPEGLRRLLGTLRPAIHGSFSVKCRSGYDDPEQIFALVEIFEEAQVDFLILHARTVEQKFRGEADHRVTRRLVEATRLPVILNGDVRDAEQGLRWLAESGAAGLMIGRGALADPLLFARLRGDRPARVDAATGRAELHAFLDDLLERYGGLFHGERQVLMKIKDVLGFVPAEELEMEPILRRLRRSKTMARFRDELDALLGDDPRRSAA